MTNQNKRARAWMVTALLAAAAIPAAAADRSARLPGNAVTSLIACRAIPDIVQRVTCYDREIAALQEAQKRRDIVVVDRADVQETKRSLFGLSLPRLSILGKDDAEDLSEISGTVESATTDREGRVLIKMADGGRWRQTDEMVLGRFPKPGTAMVIRRGALGSFRISVGGQPAFKARREN